MASTRLSEQMNASLEQKRKDLELVRSSAERSLMSQANSGPSETEVAESQQRRSRIQASSPNSTIMEAPSETDKGAQVQDEALKSTAEVEWSERKQNENVSNDAMDELMKMTGLEEVKNQFLRIMSIIDVVLRQNIEIKDQRFGVVLLGNPGTGKSCCSLDCV